MRLVNLGTADKISRRADVLSKLPRSAYAGCYRKTVTLGNEDEALKAIALGTLNVPPQARGRALAHLEASGYNYGAQQDLGDNDGYDPGQEGRIQPDPNDSWFQDR